MNSQTNRISRDSNMELYRIVCMMLVVLFHVCGVIDITNDNLSPDDRSIGVLPTQLITSATFVCVDVFVLLSGWYGIKAKLSIMPENTRYKLSQTVTKIVNKGSSNLIAIVL